MTHSITTIAPDNVPSLTYGGKPVVTTAVLAELYGTEEARIRKNHSRNKDRFESGKHFYKVEGKELSDLRESLRHSQIPAKARAAILWTERGAARHAKMLETNQAWDVFEALEDHYFGPHQQAAEQQKALPNPLSPRHQRELQKAIASRVYAQVPEAHRPSAFKRIYSHLKDRFEVGTYKDIDDSRYTEALGAVQSFELEGEFLDPESKPQKAALTDEQLSDMFLLLSHVHWFCHYWRDARVSDALYSVRSPAAAPLTEHVKIAELYKRRVANTQADLMRVARDRLGLDGFALPDLA